jgi:RNA polymerase sigma-70 factor (ECF subfamily)
LTLASRAKTNSPDKTLTLSGSRLSSAAPKAAALEAVEQEVAELYASHAARLHRYGGVLVSDSALVQEAIQEAFLAYFTERLEDREIPDSRAWLFRTVRSYLQKNQEQPQIPAMPAEGLDAIPDRQQNAEAAIHQKEVLARVSSALSPREFECVSLRAEGLSYLEIAKVMEIRLGTVGVLLARGLKKLRRVL